MSSITEHKKRLIDKVVREAVDQILLITADSHEKGRLWEEQFRYLAASQGLDVQGSDGRGDLTVNGLVVQCKHIDATRSGDVLDIANMRPVSANGNHRGYLVGEYDVLALRHYEAIYIVPSQALEAGNGTLLSRVRLSEISSYLDAWHVFSSEYVPPKRAMQMILPIGEDATDRR